MTYHLIGAGNMAMYLLRRLTAAGHACVGIWNRTEEKGRLLAVSEGIPFHASLSAINDGADICIIAVPDDAIPDIVTQLSFRHTVLLHTSGATPAGVLAKGSRHYGVLWPVYSIRGSDIPEHKAFPVIWSSNSAAGREIVSSIAIHLGSPAQEADDETRRALHLAAVFGNNFINHLLAISQQLCAAAGARWSLLQPLIQQTVDGAAAQDAGALQTGPAKRGDRNTMDLHRNLLTNRPEWAALYELLSASIIASGRGRVAKP